MKKFLIFSIASIFLLTGCGATETLSCSYQNTANNGSTKISYDIDHENNEVKKVRITYDYKFNDKNDNGSGNNANGTNNNGATDNNNSNNQIDGVGTGTDGTTSDSQLDKDGIVDGVVGSAIDTIIGGMTDMILDAAGIRNRHVTVQNTYGNINGFSVQNITDVDNNYKVTYVIDYDNITDENLAKFNLSRDINAMRESYVNSGFTCK